VSVLKLQGASKNKAETYFLYVEHLFLRSNAVDASPKNVRPVHSWATSLQANSLLYGTTDVLVGSEKPFTVSFFANRQDRYEARAQINRRRIYDTLRINLCAATK